MPVSPDLLIVEDGSIVADANSYITYDYAENYHALRGNSAWAAGDPSEKQYAIVRATQAVDSIYKGQWGDSPSGKSNGKLLQRTFPKDLASLRGLW